MRGYFLSPLDDTVNPHTPFILLLKFHKLHSVYTKFGVKQADNGPNYHLLPRVLSWRFIWLSSGKLVVWCFESWPLGAKLLYSYKGLTLSRTVNTTILFEWQFDSQIIWHQTFLTTEFLGNGTFHTFSIFLAYLLQLIAEQKGVDKGQVTTVKDLQGSHFTTKLQPSKSFSVLSLLSSTRLIKPNFCLSLPVMQHHSFFRNKKFVYLWLGRSMQQLLLMILNPLKTAQNI